MKCDVPGCQALGDHYELDSEEYFHLTCAYICQAHIVWVFFRGVTTTSSSGCEYIGAMGEHTIKIEIEDLQSICNEM